MINEINKCLNCPNPRCQKGCPLNQDIRDFIQASKTDLQLARTIIDKKNILSSFCSLVCPHDLQCEGSCVLGIKKEPVKIGAIEQYIIKNTISSIEYKQVNKKVLVIGSGPAGISFSYLALKHGMSVDLYEKEKQLGGIPMYGIPNFRYDKNSYLEYINYVKENASVYNKTLGLDFNLEDVVDNYDYIYLAVGSDNPNKLRIDGVNLDNVVMSKDFLMNFNNNKLDLKDKDVVVIGAGNVAMDAARCALKANAASSSVVYRRTLSESTASQHEINDAKNEGVIFKFLSAPNKFNGTNGVESLTVEVMKLEVKEGERPYPVGTNVFKDIKTNYVVLAIGQKLPDEIKKDSLIEFDEWGGFVKALNDKILVGGDLINGPSSVARAISDSYEAIKKILFQ